MLVGITHLEMIKKKKSGEFRVISVEMFAHIILELKTNYSKDIFDIYG